MKRRPSGLKAMNRGRFIPPAATVMSHPEGIERVMDLPLPRSNGWGSKARTAPWIANEQRKPAAKDRFLDPMIDPLGLQFFLEHLGEGITTTVEGHLLVARPRILGELEPGTLAVGGTSEFGDLGLDGLD